MHIYTYCINNFKQQPIGCNYCLFLLFYYIYFLAQVYVGVPVQVAEEQPHGVLVWFGQLMDQFLNSLNFMFGFFDFCSKKQKQLNLQVQYSHRATYNVVECI